MNNDKAITMMVQHIKFLAFGMMLLFYLPLVAQNKTTTITNTKDTYKRTAFSLKENVHNYTYEVLEDGNYEVIVIGPDGALLSKPVKKQAFAKEATITFSVNSKYWKAGLYKIIIAKEEGKSTVYKLTIANNKLPHKKINSAGPHK